ncbi:MAG: LuxR C-terminal-related transcriptional regulator [Coriobacteriales bacterium]|jgi:DNA-binding CsgD family transcriptional regulator|nr:LuxR C-terminal-related transcriptional regulator [Coriobacteriales bacterium]
MAYKVGSLRLTLLAAFGASCLFATGYLSFLSPALFLIHPRNVLSVHIELVFFASQAMAVLFALILCIWARQTGRQMPNSAVVGAAVLLSLTTVAETFTTLLGPDNESLMILLGALNGLTLPILTAAWGARFSWESRHQALIIVLTFIFSYGLFFLISRLIPLGYSAMVTSALPLLSVGLWYVDLTVRRFIAVGSWRMVDNGKGLLRISEIIAGKTNLSTLPYQALIVLAIAAFVGDFTLSVGLGFGYKGATIITNTGFLFGALFLLVFCTFLFLTKRSVRIDDLYRIMLPLAVIGLLATLVLGDLVFDGTAMFLPLGMLRGNGLFFQVLVFFIIAQVTRQEGFSPLVTFSAGVIVISSQIFFAHIIGKLFFLTLGSSKFALMVVLAIAICGLVIVLSFYPLRTRKQDSGTISYEYEERPIHESYSVETDTALNEQIEKKVATFTASHCLSPREGEVVRLLVRGYTTPHIAEQLFVTTGTIKTHLLHIYQKVGSSGRQELIDSFYHIEK